MRRTKSRRIKRASLPLASLDAKTTKKSWAERHAPLATIIAGYSTLMAVIIAGLGYYFTVIPLYQKAAVDELIAKREIELKEASIAIAIARREAYEQQRINFGRTIEFPVLDCSDVQRSFMSPTLDFDNQSAISTDHEKHINLEVEVAPCLASVLTKYNAAKVLTETDFRHIKFVFLTTGTALDKMRIEAINRIADLPQLANHDPSILAPVGPIVERADYFLRELDNILAATGNKIPAQEEKIEKRLQYRISLTQREIANEYRSNASQLILATVRGMTWPTEEKSVSVEK